MRNASVGLALCLALSACGTRTSLTVDPPIRVDGGDEVDGGRDGGMDGGVDGGPPDGGMVLLECGRRDRYTSPRRPLTIEPGIEGEMAPLDARWTLVEGPGGAMPEMSQRGLSLTITPFLEGDYLLVLQVVDAAGQVATCEVLVHSVVGPPVAICPEERLFTSANEPLTVIGDGYDDEAVVAYEWAILSSPDGATVSVEPPVEPVVEFLADTRGDYLLELTVWDEDMATSTCQVMVAVTGPPEVECPPDQEAPTRQLVRLTARDADDVGIASRRWELLERPARSEAAPRPLDEQRTSFTPDRQGDYVFRYTVTDVEGFEASCEVTVTGTPTPPTVTCPEEVEVAPLETAEIGATAEDDGEIAGWRWTLTSKPMTSDAAPPSPATSPNTRFTPDIAGVYEVTVTATDDDGMTGTCTTRVVAGNVDGLRVEMAWDTTGTDMDLHLMNREGARWQTEDDCYYANCNTNGSGVPVLDWYGPDDEDDPRLDIDDTDGRGPENINIERPEPGTYRVAVLNFSGAGPNRVTVNVYCGGSTTEPSATFGPAVLRGRRRGSSEDFWRVADVTVDASGCSVTDLRRDDGSYWIEPTDTTLGMR